MDIHTPKHPIHSVRAFLTEIATVTCGIVIALSLEALITRWHDRDLAAHARIQFHAELRSNEAELRRMLAADPADEALIGTLLTYAHQRLDHQPAKLKLASTAERGFPDLSDTAWQTALATQAVGQLRFAEVQALSRVYESQRGYTSFQLREMDQWVGIAAYGDIASLTDDEVRHASQALRIAYAYQHSAAAMATDLIGKMAAAENTLAKGN